MDKSARRFDARRRDRRMGLRERIAHFVRALFSSGPEDLRFDPPVGGVGVREPRRPPHPSRPGAVVLEVPTEEMRDVWAVGDEGRG